MSHYPSHPMLVDTQWVAEHANDANVRLVETDLSPADYQSGHLPGAVFWNMPADLLKPDFSINFEVAAMETLLSRSGISQETTVVCYGSLPSIGATLFWLLKVFGHKDVRVLEGGRQKWIAEGRALESDSPEIAPTAYHAQAPDAALRVFHEEVQEAIHDNTYVLLDVRSPEEFSGEWYYAAPPQGDERAGHIPGAVHIGFEQALNADGTFKSPQELTTLYSAQGVTPDKAVITYCTVGARSSQIWFVLKHLLGYPNVRNYDGSWREWSRLSD